MKNTKFIIFFILLIIIGIVIYKKNNAPEVININVSSIRIDNSSIILEIGDRKQLNVIVSPEGAKVDNIIWSTDDNSVVTVTSNGLVVAKGSGNTYVTASTSDGKLSGRCIVLVKRDKQDIPTPGIPTIKPKEEYIIKYYGTDSVDAVIRYDGEYIGTMPVLTKENYIFDGWYTERNGGTKVTENTIVYKDLKLYPHWIENINGYVITRDAYIPKSLSLTNYLYDSPTLKYRVYKDTNGHFFATIWVKNAALQLQSAIPKLNDGNNLYHSVKVSDNLNNEIVKYSYQSKGLIAVNGSFSWSTDPGVRVIINRGRVIRNKETNSGPAYSSLGIRANGELKAYNTNQVNTNLLRNMLSDGVLNNWAIVGFTTSNWSGYIANEKADAARTQICQIDKNNFILANFVNSKKISYPMGWKIMHDYFPNCTFAANLDGGGSTRMYYKTNMMARVGKIYESYDTDRKNVDALYFVEQ